ncbi:hypothetical protein [Streptomyces sp. OM5714]|uniref:hypothetical protein n=1 Tax=Streptomyces sp. OM5714 TaxID=2602736 RepID=UPI0013DC7D3C|nr:hypothetical protein [Streptomyces sp. OM5714]
MGEPSVLAIKSLPGSRCTRYVRRRAFVAGTAAYPRYAQRQHRGLAVVTVKVSEIRFHRACFYRALVVDSECLAQTLAQISCVGQRFGHAAFGLHIVNTGQMRCVLLRQVAG